MSSAISNKHELNNRISDLEDSLKQLKTQLHRLEEDEQHEAIDNLEIYLEQIDHKYDNLRSFWGVVANEFRELFGKSKTDGTSEQGGKNES
ncbi:MAG: hypothetical protein JKY62_14580 [Desulfocapsa sp.]|nr:hypothetical protein [Desulfocapsa sp.]MBN4060031.1 hypothetical protein [Desulfotalea psychrophila]